MNLRLTCLKSIKNDWVLKEIKVISCVISFKRKVGEFKLMDI